MGMMRIYACKQAHATFQAATVSYLVCSPQCINCGVEINAICQGMITYKHRDVRPNSEAGIRAAPDASFVSLSQHSECKADMN